MELLKSYILQIKIKRPLWSVCTYTVYRQRCHRERPRSVDLYRFCGCISQGKAPQKLLIEIWGGLFKGSYPGPVTLLTVQCM